MRKRKQNHKPGGDRTSDKDTCDIDGSEFSDGTGMRNNDQTILEVGKSIIYLFIVHSVFDRFPDERRNKVYGGSICLYGSARDGQSET
jgi:hypothetical protein